MAINEPTVKLHEIFYCDSNTKATIGKKKKKLCTYTKTRHWNSLILFRQLHIEIFQNYSPRDFWIYKSSVSKLLFSLSVLPTQAARSPSWTHFQLTALTVLDEPYTS